MKCHFVPQFYLNQWADYPKRELLSYRRVNGRLIVKRRTPAGVCYENDLYSFAKVEPEKRHFIEKRVLGEGIEELAAPILRKMVHEGVRTLSNDERSDWSRFILSMRARTPEFIHRLKTGGLQDILASLDAANDEYRILAGANAPEKFSEWVNVNQPGLLENLPLTILPKLFFEMDSPKTIFKMQWWIADFNGTSIEIITSDRPCQFYGKGKDDPEAFFMLPLSPHHVFFAAHDQDRCTKVFETVGRGRLGLNINAATMNLCHEFVFGTLRGSMVGHIEKYLKRGD